jgi:1-acyl-sn-glycerol-3-phosphate acyltransferase
MNRIKKNWILFKCAMAVLNVSLKVIYYALIRKSLKPRIEDAMKQWGDDTMRYIQGTLIVNDPHHMNQLNGKKIIIISNHESLLDIPIIYAGLTGPIRMVAKKELSRVPIWGRAMKLADVPLIDRKNKKEAVKSLQFAGSLLEKGIKIWIAPEGTRTRDGQLQKFKKGAFVMAIQTGATIIPVGIKGAYDIMPAKTTELNLGQTITLNIGEAIDASEYTMKDKEALIERAEKVIAELTQ